MCGSGDTGRGGPLKIRDLRKSFDRRMALDGLTLDVAPGEVVGLPGSGGSGTTTAGDRASPAGGRRAPGGRIEGFAPICDRPEAGLMTPDIPGCACTTR